MLKIVNIVATVKMEKKFNLDILLEKLPNAKQSKHWVNIRLPKFNNYIAFYKNAKFLITGAHSEKELNILLPGSFISKSNLNKINSYNY